MPPDPKGNPSLSLSFSTSHPSVPSRTPSERTRNRPPRLSDLPSRGSRSHKGCDPSSIEGIRTPSLVLLSLSLSVSEEGWTRTGEREGEREGIQPTRDPIGLGDDTTGRTRLETRSFDPRRLSFSFSRLSRFTWEERSTWPRRAPGRSPGRARKERGDALRSLRVPWRRPADT